MQVLSGMVDYGMEPQEALDAPRFRLDGVDSCIGPASVNDSVCVHHSTPPPFWWSLPARPPPHMRPPAHTNTRMHACTRCLSGCFTIWSAHVLFQVVAASHNKLATVLLVCCVSGLRASTRLGNGRVYLEEGFSDEAVADLKRRGYQVCCHSDVCCNEMLAIYPP